jgi:hypothetical protein
VRACTFTDDIAIFVSDTEPVLTISKIERFRVNPSKINRQGFRFILLDVLVHG